MLSKSIEKYGNGGQFIILKEKPWSGGPTDETSRFASGCHERRVWGKRRFCVTFDPYCSFFAILLFSPKRPIILRTKGLLFTFFAFRMFLGPPIDVNCTMIDVK